MLCSPSHSSTMLPYASNNHGLTGVVESSLSAGQSSSSSSNSCGGDVRSPSPSVGQHTRPRHHVRSFSQEKRFDENSSSIGSTTIASTPPALQTNNVHQLPVRAKRSPSIDSSDQSVTTTSTASSSRTSSSSSQASMPRVLNSASIVSPSLPRRDASPPKAVKPLTKEETEEQEKLTKLRKAQASRRPRVMRMTPAFSSLPGKIDDKSIKLTSSDLAGSIEEDGKVHLKFPVKPSNNNDSNSLDEPSVGLQIDLACIPSPSLNDLQGPVTTSHVESLLRDRHGNPIKPSLKTPRSSVSHFLPGRSSRSDSTPSLPLASLTSKSVPTTPTVHKNVHFDSQLEHVKVFKFKQRPTAVSRDGSPEQTETETEEEKEMFPYIWKKSNSPSNDNSPTSPMRSKTASPPQEEQLVLRLPNFPSSTRLSVDREVFLERIFLADDLRSVKGTVQVRNVSFEKWVAVRYTLDHWATIGEVSAEHTESLKGGQADRFSFSIKLNELLNWPRGSAAHETKSMFICLRYTVSNGEFWDNNEGQNYQLDFRKRPIPTTPASTPMPVSLRANVPESIVNNTTRARVMEMARRGVGGKGVFAMEDLKRELEKLRSDDEAEIPSPIDAFKRRSSPPASPNSVNPSSSSTGNVRSSSPSVWTARYDFGQSLRNPRSGSRKTGEGRAAALDYFSARPMNNASASGSTASANVNGSTNGVMLNNKDSSTPTPSFSVQAASPPTKKSEIITSASSFNAKFGMISPGLGDENVEHMPVNPSSGSATPSPGATPTMTTQPLGGNGSGNNSNVGSPERFYSYPPSRHASSPGSTTPTNQNRLSPMTSMDMLRSNSGGKVKSPLKGGMMMNNEDQLTMQNHEKEGSASSTEESMQSSPRSSPPSDGGSPNPFSPSISVSSIESDTTISNVTSPDSIRSSTIPSSTLIAASAAVPEPTTSTKRMKKNVDSTNDFMAEATKSPFSYQGYQSNDFNTNPVSLTSFTPSGENEGLRTGEEEEGEDLNDLKKQYRPASMSDYQELVDKFCWNSDLVPSGGSMIPDMPVNGGLSRSSIFIDGKPMSIPISPSSIHTSNNGSGASTPTGLH